MPETKITEDEAGKVCPYCHVGLAQGEAAHRCGTCGALHHGDCWTEGQGCSVFGCEGEEATAADPGSQEQSSSVASSAPGEPLAKRRSSVFGGARKRTLLIVGGAATVLAIGAAAFLIFGGGNDEPEKPAKPKTVAGKPNGGKPNGGTNKQAENARKKREKQRKKREQIRLSLAPDWVNDPGGNWAGVLPSGPGWGALMDLGNKNDEYEPRYETKMNGPGPEFVFVHTTPVTDPTAEEANYTINETLRESSSVPARSMAQADLILYKDGPDECAPVSCAKVLMADGRGGGITIVAGSRSSKTALIIVKEFALRVEPRY